MTKHLNKFAKCLQPEVKDTSDSIHSTKVNKTVYFVNIQHPIAVIDIHSVVCQHWAWVNVMSCHKIFKLCYVINYVTLILSAYHDHRLDSLKVRIIILIHLHPQAMPRAYHSAYTLHIHCPTICMFLYVTVTKKKYYCATSYQLQFHLSN